MDAILASKVAYFSKAIKEIADGTSPDLTVRQLMLLLAVGSKTSPVGQQELVETMDEYKSTVSKMVAALSGTTGDVRREGLGLLNVDLDPNDLRSRVVSLTADGEKLLSRAMKQAQPK